MPNPAVTVPGINLLALLGAAVTVYARNLLILAGLTALSIVVIPYILAYSQMPGGVVILISTAWASILYIVVLLVFFGETIGRNYSLSELVHRINMNRPAVGWVAVTQLIFFFLFPSVEAIVGRIGGDTVAGIGFYVVAAIKWLVMPYLMLFAATALFGAQGFGDTARNAFDIYRDNLPKILLVFFIFAVAQQFLVYIAIFYMNTPLIGFVSIITLVEQAMEPIIIGISCFIYLAATGQRERFSLEAIARDLERDKLGRS